MSRIDEIAATLNNLPEDYHYDYRNDIAFLLAEVKRLDGDVGRYVQVDDLRVGPCMWREMVEQRDELRALALSLAEALERYDRKVSRGRATYEDHQAVKAALSSPALLKLKGGK